MMRRLKISYAIAIVGLFVISFSFAAMSFVGAATNGVDDQKEIENKRVVTWSVTNSDAELHSQRESETREDQLQISVSTANFLKISVQYESDSNQGSVDLHFDVVFYSLVEYVDTNANGIYDVATDTKVKEVPLNSFNALSNTTETAADGTPIYIVKGTTTDNVFGFELRLLEQFNTLNGSLVTPGEGKIDIKITNFPYTQPSGSALALHVRLESESGYQSETNTEDEANGYSSNEAGVRANENGYSGFFTWNETALVDGVVQPVKASPVATDDVEANQHMIYLCYPRGASIIHDPKIGVEGITNVGIPGYPLLILLGLSGSAMLALIIKRRHTR